MHSKLGIEAASPPVKPAPPPEDEKDDYQGYLDRMRAMIEAAQAPAPDDD